MQNPPKILCITGTCGRLPDELLGMADMIRLPRGPQAVLLEEPQRDAIFQAVEIAARLHDVKQVEVSGPWRFHGFRDMGHRSRCLRRHFEDVIDEAVDVLQREFPQLDVRDGFDEQLFATTDWGAPLDVTHSYFQCMDPRLDRHIRRVRDKHGSRAIVARFPGSLAATLDPRFEKLWLEECRIVDEVLNIQGTRSLKAIPTGHRRCGYLALPDPIEEMSRHKDLAPRLIDWLRCQWGAINISVRHLDLSGEVTELAAA